MILLSLSDTTPLSPVKTPPYRSLAIASLGVGALLLVLSVCALGTFLVLPFYSIEGALGNNTAVLSLAAVFIAYGTLLVLIGGGILRNRFNSVFRLPPPLIFVGAFFLVLILGQAILALNLAPAHLFPLWHVLGSLLVPLAVLSFAARRLGPVSLRSMLAQFSWGGLVTIFFALILELIVGAVIVIAAILAIVMVLGADRMAELAAALRQVPVNSQGVMEIIQQQPVALGIAALAAVFLIVFAVPLLEELLKAAGPAILIARRQRTGILPTKSEALLWGLAAGAGYAFTENMFNAQSAVSSSAGVFSFWVTAMLLRAGTSLMHIIATGTVSIGWYYALVLKRPTRLVLFLLAALGVHGLWNTSALLLGGASSLTSLGPNLNLVSSALGGAVLFFLVLLFVGFLFWLRALIRWAQPPPVEIITSKDLPALSVQNAKEF